MRNAERVRELEDVLARLQQSGDVESAERVRRVVEDLRDEERDVSTDLVTAAEAAEMLGVRSLHMVWLWVREGNLEGHRLGERVLVSRPSIERWVNTPAVERQQAFERELAAAIEPFESEDEQSIDQEELSALATWGRGENPGHDRVHLPADRPPLAVVDSCVFGHLQEWIAPLVNASVAGDADLFWSPTIIAETHRLLTWRWLERHGGDVSRSSRRACSVAAKAFMRRVRLAFSVVEDRPPDEPMWTNEPRDEWDIPLWNAAVRCHADFVVTENLRDGPPTDAEGIRQYQGIVFIHPRDFIALLRERAARRALLATEREENSAS